MDVISYEQARDHIRSGDVVFIRDKAGWFIPHLIRFFTRSRYTHVGIAFWMHTGGARRLMIVEAQGGAKRRVLNLSYYEDVNLDIIEAPGKWEEVSGRALEKLNQVPYGWLEALYVGLREFLLKYFNWDWLKRRDLPGEICSEFVAKIYELPQRHISPQALLELLLSQGHGIRAHVRKQD